MADPNQDERELPASDRRRKEFRDRGEVAQSREISSTALLLAAIVGLMVFAPMTGRTLIDYTQRSFDRIAQPTILDQGAQAVALEGLKGLALCVLPLLLLLAVVALAANLLQVGFLFTATPLKPDLKKISPFGRFKEIFFSAKAGVEALKAVAKLAAIAIPLYLLLEDRLEEAAVLVGLPPIEIASTALDGVTGIALRVCAVFLVIAALDYTFQRHRLEKRMRMTQQEAKEEHKEREGDPQVKGRVRRIQREMAMNRMMADVPNADVIVANPDHFAVALRYRAGKDAAPVVLAKGQDALALRIKDIGFHHGIPIVENPPVARALYRAVKVGKTVPAELFRAVAEILAYVYRTNAAAQGAPRRLR